MACITINPEGRKELLLAMKFVRKGGVVRVTINDNPVSFTLLGMREEEIKETSNEESVVYKMGFDLAYGMRRKNDK